MGMRNGPSSTHMRAQGRGVFCMKMHVKVCFPIPFPRSHPQLLSRARVSMHGQSSRGSGPRSFPDDTDSESPSCLAGVSKLTVLVRDKVSFPGSVTGSQSRRDRKTRSAPLEMLIVKEVKVLSACPASSGPGALSVGLSGRPACVDKRPGLHLGCQALSQAMPARRWTGSGPFL